MGLEPCDRLSTLAKMNISETRGPIAIKFNLEHQWSGENATLGLGPDQIITLVSMEQFIGEEMSVLV